MLAKQCNHQGYHQQLAAGVRRVAIIHAATAIFETTAARGTAGLRHVAIIHAATAIFQTIAACGTARAVVRLAADAAHSSGMALWLRLRLKCRKAA